jgi:hypothetical protein
MPQPSPSPRKLHYKLPHHGTMTNNPNRVPISVNPSLQQLIVIIVNIPLNIDAPTFVDLLGEFFRVLELEFPVKFFEKILQFPPFIGRKMKPSRCFT